MRHWAPMKEGKSLWWKVIARNKRLITLSLSTKEGQEIFKSLVQDADVVDRELPSRNLRALGARLRRACARSTAKVIVVRVSGFGQTGPYSHRGGYGTVAECFSGAPSFTGFPDRPPTLPRFPLADFDGCHLRRDGGDVRDLSARPGRRRARAGDRCEPLRAAVPA